MQQHLPNRRAFFLSPRNRTTQRALLTLAATLTLSLTLKTNAAELALVIDDVGHNLSRADQVLALPGSLTVGLLPFASNTAEIARRAHAAGKEVILHQPMQPQGASRQKSEDGTLTLNMAPDTFVELLDAALDAVPHCVGVNNHTGSLLTEHRESMVRLMKHIRSRGLFFLDSRTSPDTLAYRVAREWQVPAAKRDVFLDHVPEEAAIAAEFERALAIARRRGHAVLIAHPRRQSLKFLQAALTDLPRDVELVPLSLLTNRQRPATLARLESRDFLRISPAR